MSQEVAKVNTFNKTKLWKRICPRVSCAFGNVVFVSCFTIKIKKSYDGRLIWYSYLVLGTRSAAKFEKVPRTSLHRVIVRCHAQSTRGPCISSDTKMLRYFWCNPDYPQSNIQCTSYRFFFNWASPEFAKCWPVSNWFQKNVRVPDWPPLWSENG